MDLVQKNKLSKRKNANLLHSYRDQAWNQQCIPSQFLFAQLCFVFNGPEDRIPWFCFPGYETWSCEDFHVFLLGSAYCFTVLVFSRFAIINYFSRICFNSIFIFYFSIFLIRLLPFFPLRGRTFLNLRTY